MMLASMKYFPPLPQAVIVMLAMELDVLFRMRRNKDMLLDSQVYTLDSSMTCHHFRWYSRHFDLKCQMR
jgi:hypothetical protein